MAVKKILPKFINEKEEAEFWLTHDSIDYVDWSEAKRVDFLNLKHSDVQDTIFKGDDCWITY